MLKQRALTPSENRRVFLSLLNPSAELDVFHFRTFDDTPAKRGWLAENVSAHLCDCEQALEERNTTGAGVFAVINEGGQTDAEITRVRAVFADTDGAPLEPLLEALAPHFVIESSPGKWHVYYLVAEDFPLDRFKSIQKAIAAKFGTDPKVNNLSRVMRLPGFLHNKGEPFDVRFAPEHLNIRLPRYGVERIIEGLGLSGYLPVKTASLSPPTSSYPPPAQGHSIAEIEAMLRFIDPWRDRDRWMKVVFAVADVLGEPGCELIVRWSHGDLWQRVNHEAE